MACKRKYNFSNSFPFISKFIILIYFMSDIVTTTSEECVQISNCKCRFSNGSIIDLSRIGPYNDARFKNVTSRKDNYTYYYNPCYPFTLSGACTKVAVCQVSKPPKIEYQNCGNENGGFVWNSYTNSLNLIYTEENGPRKSNVTLVCSKDAIVPRLEDVEENSRNTYNMKLISRCACADLCREDHYSAGSVLVILFMISVALYLVLGIIHSSLTRGAHGWELIPHYEFWADFPLLVRDGCVFVISGCKADTAYERI